MSCKVLSNSVSGVPRKLKSNKLPLFVVLLAAAAITCSCATSEQDLRAGMNLYSWRLGSGEYAFAFVPKRQNDNFLRTFRRQRSDIVGITKLDVEFAKFPRGSSITWRDYEVVGLTFPSAPVRRQIENLARSRGLQLEVVPTIYN
jgi:hypothetical protein